MLTESPTALFTSWNADLMAWLKQVIVLFWMTLIQGHFAYFLMPGLCLFLCWVGPSIQRMGQQENTGFLVPIRLLGRLFFSLGFLGLLGLFFLFLLGFSVSLIFYSSNEIKFLLSQMGLLRAVLFLSGLIFGGLCGFGATIWIGRSLHPRVNRWLTRMTKKQNKEGLTDVRQVQDYLPQTIDYDPTTYFDPKGDTMFLGLDETGKPVTVARTFWKKSHVQVMGPTGTGKGVISCVTLAQSIAFGDCIIVIDPKHDEWASSVLADACEKAGKPFHWLDLRREYPPQFNLLNDISESELQELLIAGFSLGRKGEAADHYRSRDRRACRQLAKLINKQPNLSLYELHGQAADFLGKEQAEKAEGFLMQLEELAELPCSQTSEGLNLKEILLNGDCLYIVGSTEDEAILMMQRMVFVRIKQLLSLRDRTQTQRHCTVFLDEVKYILSAPALKALGTIRDKGCNLVLAHQALGDFYHCGSDLDGGAVQSVILGNTQIKWIYQTQPDTQYRTLDWVVSLTGTIQVPVERKKVERNEWLAQTDESERFFSDQSRPLIDHNMIQNLPNRCAVVIGAGQAKLAFSAPYLTEKRRFSVTPAKAIKTQLDLKNSLL